MSFVSLMSQLGEGFIATLQVFFLTLLGALPLGLVVAFLRMNHLGFHIGKRKIRPISLITQFYISVMRGTPLMLQLLVVYFAPYYVFGMQLSDTSRFTAVIIAFILNYAAYYAEIYRSGIQGVPKGQYEAAEVLGYTRSQTFFRIIFPQMVKRILPPMTNEIVTLIKDTSLAFAVGFVEMFTVARSISNSQRSLMAFFAAAIIYYVANLLIAWIMGRFEKKLSYYHD